MAITLGSVVLSDAEVTDGIGLGDVDAAARLWVRYWPTAHSAARMYVESDEVPGLAAEALIGTIAAISVGRGPREDLNAFVTAAVTELGESDEPAPSLTAPAPPEVFVSPMMTRAFAGLSGEDQEILWLTIAGDRADQLIAEALNVPPAAAVEARLGALSALQRDYLAEHTEHAEEAACQQAHGAMAAAVARGRSLGGGTWVHMSECAWCTEAFHELAFSNVAINALVDRAALEPVAVAPAPVIDPAAAVVPVAADVADDVVEPLLEELPPVPYEPELEPAPSRDHAAALSPVSMLRGRRTRIVAAALVAAAAITAGVLVLTSLDSPDATLTTAGGQTQDEPTEEPESFVSVAPPLVEDVPTPTKAPATSATPTPTTAVTVVAPPTQPAGTPRPTTAAPSPTPKPTPSATPKPSPSTPPASPTPTPTPPRCNALAHLLGFC